MSRIFSRKLVALGLTTSIALGVGGAAFAYLTTTGSGSGAGTGGAASTLTINPVTPVYDSVPSPLPSSLASLGFESDATSELGNEVNLTSSGTLSDVVVTMDSWACETGSWGSPDCTTTVGATFPASITFTVYHALADGGVGAPITSDTQTFDIPFRPSADNVHCTGANAGAWWDGSACNNGLATNITFDAFGGATVPSQVIYGVSYNTSDYGQTPGDCSPAVNCDAIDSLNVALNTTDTGAPTIGSDVYPGKIDWSTTNNWYCDGGVTGTFRLDSPSCQDWSANAPSYVGAPYYTPSVEIDLAGMAAPVPGGPAVPITYSINNPNGNGDLSLGVVSEGGGGITISNAPGTCDADWFTIAPASTAVGVIDNNTTFVSGNPVTNEPTISEANVDANQDGCIGADISVALSAGQGS